MKEDRKFAVCNTCTVMLVEKAYGKAPWFRLVREPLRFGMKALAVIYRIDPRDYPVRSASCGGCVRFLKTALKEKSPLFNRLNNIINPVFDRLMERYVSRNDIAEAKRHARESTQ